MKYDASACHFNMDTGCVELQLRDGRKISIDCTGVEDALDITAFLSWCCPAFFWRWLTNFNGIFILLQFSLRLFYLFHANLYAHG